MKKAAVVVAVMILALALSQSAIAAPMQGFATAAQHTKSDDLYARILAIFGAVWGGGGGGSNHGAVWGGGGGSNHGTVLGGSNTSADGAVWTGCRSGC